jgi:hypothetical protein
MTLPSKSLLPVLGAVLLFSACQKNLSTSDDAITAEAVSTDALLPLPCHSISFTIDKPAVAGEVPPFSFTKTLYSDTRVKTIHMLSRVNPIYPGYAKQAVELTGTFTYGTNRAYLKGTSQVWEYYKTSTGAAAKKSISKKNVSLKFYFETQGFATGMVKRITDLTQSPNATEEWMEHEILWTAWSNEPNGGSLIFVARPDRAGNAGIYYYTRNDQYGNPVDFYFPYNTKGYVSYVTYSYDYNIPRGNKNYCFIPSQNLISQEFSLLEVMQWTPQPFHQRKGVAGVFYLANNTKVVQSQVYKNYQFDAKGNQISVTYGDNVPQRTTWYCK